MKTKFSYYLTFFFLSLFFFIGANQKVKAWGYAKRNTTIETSYYLGDNLQIEWLFNTDGSGASFKRSTLGPNVDWQDNIYWIENVAEGNQRWSMPEMALDTVAVWKYSIFLGWGGSVGDNGRYYHEAAWNDGSSSLVYGSFTVAAIEKPTALTSNRSEGQIELNWSKNTANHNVFVVRYPNTNYTSPVKATSYDVGNSIGEGTVIYKGNATTYIDTSIGSDYLDYHYVFYSENNSYYSNGEVLDVPYFKLLLNNSSTPPVNGTYSDIKLSLTYSDLSKFHFISVPFALSSISATNSTQGTLTYNTDYRIYTYNTTNRASGSLGDNWNFIVDPTTLEAGKGYILGFNSTTVTSAVTLEFTSVSSVNVESSVDNMLASTGSTDSNSNWYLIGSELYDDFNIAATGLSYIQQFTGSDYSVSLLSENPTIPKYSSVFVQYAGTTNFTYSSSPVRSSVMTNTNQSTYILNMVGESHSKRAIIIGSADGDDSYQYGKDLLEMPGLATQLMELSIVHPSGKLAVDYIDDQTSQITLYNKVETSKNYSINLSGNYSADYVYLTDHLLGVTTDLLLSNYSFVGVENQPNRFTLEIVVNNSPTDLDDNNIESVSIISKDGFIHIQNILATSEVSIHNAVGKIVKQFSNIEGELLVSGLPKGIYFVTIQDRETNQVVKTILK